MVLTEATSHYTEFDHSECEIQREPLRIVIGANSLTQEGITLDINNDEFKLKCDIKFGPFVPLKYGAMGPFRFLPFMECFHTVVSMNHAISGQIDLNGQVTDFENGHGYIEGDRGRSFPEKYFWSQYTSLTENLSISASCATIPYLGLKFTGTICFVRFNGHEHRFATYLGARVEKFEKNKLFIVQGFGKHLKTFEVEVLDTDKNQQKLPAPIHGNMTQTIKESVVTSVRYKLIVGSQVLFDITGHNAAFEFFKK